MPQDKGKKLVDLLFGQPDQAAFGVFPQMKPRRSKQDPEAAKNVPVDLARGIAAGALGAPGDIESLIRLLPGLDEKTILPTSEEILKRIPGGSDTPTSRAAAGAGTLAGGFYTGPGSGVRAALSLPSAIKRAGQDFAMAAGQSGSKIFIGPKAKTWNQAAADLAVQLEKSGVDPVDIWRQTGTFRGADGIQRQEISDVGVIHRNPDQLKELGKNKLEEARELGLRLFGTPGQKDLFPKALTEAKKPVREQVKRLKEEVDELNRHSGYYGQRAKFALEHPELYKAYPELADIPVTQGKYDHGVRGSLRGGPSDMEMSVTWAGLQNDPRSTMLHEMQHAVQTLEGMAPGGNPATAFQDPLASEILKRMRQEIKKPVSFEQFQILNKYPENEAQSAYEKYVKQLAATPIERSIDVDLQKQAAMEYYQRLAGEAEARATQAREPMGPTERRQEFPYSSYDVLPEDLIVKDPRGQQFQQSIDLDQLRAGGIDVPAGGFTKEEKAKLRPLYNQGLIRVEERDGKKVLVPGKGAWYEFATPEQRSILDALQDSQGVRDLSLMRPTESLLNSAQASFYDFEIVPGVRNVPIKNLEPFLPGYDSPKEAKRIQDLAGQIQESKQIEPLFIGLHPTGETYIMEGQHRIRALKSLGYDEAPARIVVDMDDIAKAKGGSVQFTNNPDTMRLELAGGGGVRMEDGGAAFGAYTTGRKYQAAKKRAEEADVNLLKDPKTYAAVMGLLGTAPDEQGFSVLHPEYEGIKKAGEAGFIGGTALGLAPAVKPVLQAGQALAKAAAPKVGQALEQYMMERGMVLPMAMYQDSPSKVKKFVYPQESALERARQNAVKLLGLPENNTPEMRAKAMGYMDYLHGTERLDRLLEGKTLDPRRATSGPMPYGTTAPELASSYAMSKADTSRRAADEGDVSKYFEVAPKDIGIKGIRSPIPVERAWYFMSPEQKAKIRNLAPRVGYENLDEFTGGFIAHPEGVNATLSPSHWDWLMKNEAKGNPLAALREMWYSSGQLVDEPERLAEIYRLAGVDAPISQTKAPWTEAKGVLLGKARITNPIDTSNTEQVSALIEPLKQAFSKDRSKNKVGGPDQWAKESRYTPKTWVAELEKDLSEGKESYVWTSIPDKVTAELKKLGFNGIIDRSGKGGGAKEPVVIPFDPSQVRSRFAAFDPAEMEAADLLKARGGSVKKADGGEVTVPDMTDGGKVIDGGPFKKGGKVQFTDNLDAMRMAVGRK